MDGEKSPTAQVRIGHYILGDTLGVGTFGKVRDQMLFISRGNFGSGTLSLQTGSVSARSER